MPTTVEVRIATPDDAPQLLQLVQQYWAFESIAGFDPQGVAAQLRRLLSQPHLGCGWIASSDGAPAGYLLAVYVFSLEHLGLTAELDELFVLPRYRGSGLGARLLHSAEALFRDVGCTNVSLQLARGNDAGRRFYRQHGYAQRAGYEILDKMLPAD